MIEKWNEFNENKSEKDSKKELIKKIKSLKYFGNNSEIDGFDDAKKRIIEIIKKEL